MSFLYNLLFGKPVVAPTPVPTVQTIHTLAEQEAKLEKKLSYTRVRIQQLVEEAKGCVQRNEKAKALSCMKQKGLLDEQEKSFVSMLEKLTQQRLALEMNQMQRDTLHVMQQTNTVFEASEVTMDTDKAQDILENFEEKMQTQQEITRLFTQPLSGNDTQQQAEEELNRLLQEMAPPSVPATPQTILVKKQEEPQPTPLTPSQQGRERERVALLS